MRFEYKQNAFCSYIEDNKAGLTYIVTNYNDMKDLVTLLNKQSQQLADKDKEIERQDKTIREINKSKYDKLMEKDILFHLKNKNEELEAKLAESENKVKGFVELFDKKQHENYEQFCEIQQLKQQLAEKEKEIEDVRSTHIYRFYLDKYKVQDVHMTDLMLEVFNQDKISFCIERLEKVKEWLEPKYFDNEQIAYLTKIVDNQINELRERPYEQD